MSEDQDKQRASVEQTIENWPIEGHKWGVMCSQLKTDWRERWRRGSPSELDKSAPPSLHICWGLHCLQKRGATQMEPKSLLNCQLFLTSSPFYNGRVGSKHYTVFPFQPHWLKFWMSLNFWWFSKIYLSFWISQNRMGGLGKVQLVPSQDLRIFLNKLNT